MNSDCGIHIGVSTIYRRAGGSIGKNRVDQKYHCNLWHRLYTKTALVHRLLHSHSSYPCLGNVLCRASVVGNSLMGKDRPLPPVGVFAADGLE